MGKESGLGAAFFLCGYDISGDVVAVDELSGGPALLDQCTGIDKLAYERIGGQITGKQKLTTWFNPSAGQAHKRLSGLPTTDVQGQYWHRTALARPVHCIVGKQLNYDGTRAEDGSFTHESDIESNGFGAEWATGLTAGKRTDGSATNGTGVDFASGTFSGSSTFGLQAYLQVFAFTGTSVTVKLQESSDNGAGDAWADVTGGAFTVASGITFERIQTSRTQTVERYLRAVTTGTFSNAVFAVAVVRNDVLVKL
jgi:hypothetical protein